MVAMREALGLARLARGGLLTEGEVSRAIDDVLQVPGRMAAQHVAADLVAWAVQRADDKPLPEGVRA
jgi:hypothetical protein